MDGFYKKFKEMVSIYVKDRALSACAMGLFFKKGNNFVRYSFYSGTRDSKGNGGEVNDKTFFDVASLTKPVVTLLSLLALKKEKIFSFSDTIGDILEYVPEDKKSITIENLLSHESGLPAHRPYYSILLKKERKERKRKLIEKILKEPLQYSPGNGFLYSDLDYIVLGHLLEEVSNVKLEKYFEKKITDPLSLSNHFCFFGDTPEKEKSNFAVTGRCSWTGKLLCGSVHDENCRALGSLSGHAGLFSTLAGIQSITESILFQHSAKIFHPAIEREDLLYLLKKRADKKRRAGFDVPSGSQSASGKYFSDNTIGHLGFTGTSFWIDLKENIIIVLLTNRVVYGDDNVKIRKIRPVLHDIAMEAISRERLLF